MSVDLTRSIAHKRQLTEAEEHLLSRLGDAEWEAMHGRSKQALAYIKDATYAAERVMTERTDVLADRP